MPRPVGIDACVRRDVTAGCGQVGGGIAVNASMEREPIDPAPVSERRFQFNIDKRIPIIRMFLSFGFIASAITVLIYAEVPFSVMVLLAAAVVFAAIMAKQSTHILRMQQPVLSVGPRGIWDRRLNAAVIPWSDIFLIRTDRNGDIILDPKEQFTGIDEAATTRWQNLRRQLDTALQPGSLRIDMSAVDGKSGQLLAGIEASLPQHLRSMYRPDFEPADARFSRRTIFAGVGALAIGAMMFVVTSASTQNAAPELQSLGSAMDSSAIPGHYESAALSEFRVAAKKGDASARVRLGLMYHEGDGVARNREQAAQWFRLAAKDNQPAGQAALGYLHETGLGVSQDFGKALTWYRKAADRDNSWAQYRLALMYRDGRGIRRNPAEAVRLLTAAAIKGDVAGRFHLGEMYDKGWGVPQDASVAADWYRKAAEQDHDQAEYALGTMYRDGRGSRRDPVRAALWFERSARKGYAPAQYALGLAYEVGRGVARDMNRATLWFSLAERHGDQDAAQRRRQVYKHLNRSQRQDADTFQKKWLKEHALSEEAAEKFKVYSQMKAPKAFAIAMNGAWAQTENAKHVRDAVYHAMKRCRQYADACMLFAVGDKVVIGMREAEIDAVIAKQLKTASR